MFGTNDFEVYNVMNLQVNRLLPLRLLLSVLLVCLCMNKYSVGNDETATESLCIGNDETIRAKNNKCLLRPDTGPCRADILSYYYDAKQKRCYRFFFGGCQGNGNNFKTRRECLNECFLGPRTASFHRPYFCSLAFDYGTCFGHYTRYGWDQKSEICKQRIYSGCGGNQNNFETKIECMATCLSKPNNTMSGSHQHLTTCIPYVIPDFD